MNRRNFLKAAVGAALVPVVVGLIPASGRDGWFNEQSLEDAVAALRLDRQYHERKAKT